MAAEFRSFAEILRAAPPQPALETPVISALIPEPPAPQADQHRLEAARREERLEHALYRLLEEIAAEIVARELLLAPADVAAIVERLVLRYRFDAGFLVEARNGDVLVVAGDGALCIDASLGRRVRAAIDRALA